MSSILHVVLPEEKELFHPLYTGCDSRLYLILGTYANSFGNNVIAESTYIWYVLII